MSDTDGKCDNCQEIRPDAAILYLGLWCLPFILCDDCRKLLDIKESSENPAE